MDTHITFRFPKLKAQVKRGGPDIFNHRYLQNADGPTIGALYYAAIRVDGLVKN